ncbi:MAG: hypothetical protein JW913_20285 [Chitinispirillaceae bacterium]|nr:hypothetical protein [Chitinispirillaceae bacterium]
MVMTAGKRILIFPNSNTLSHVSRALSLCKWLAEEGYETHIGVSNSRKNWVQGFWPRCHGILELWEPSGKPFPSPGWFSDGVYCEACVTSQEAVIDTVRPDLIIGIFDFVSGISRKSTPHLSINGACMLPWNDSVLGFDEKETPERRDQKKIFRIFWAFAAKSFRQSLEKRHRDVPSSALEFLLGNVNCIYEIPEIAGITSLPPSHNYIGPVVWEGWDDIGEKVPWRRNGNQFTVYLNSGTLMKSEQTMATIINECLARGFRLLMSSGDKGPSWSTERLFCRPFLAPSDVLRRADLVVCTGGVGACYMNLKFAVPSLVIPMQPEQATNGINLARSGCGEVYRHNVVFLGDADRYRHPFDQKRFGQLLDVMTGNPDGYGERRRISKLLADITTREKVLAIVKGMA